MNAPVDRDAARADTSPDASSRAVKLRTGNWAELGADALAVRTAVFVREQRIPLEIEHDEHDEHAVHCVAYRGERPVGTGRLLPQRRIGRMAVLSDERRSGIGRRILGELVACAAQRGDSEIELHAQQYVASFYASHGFTPVGDAYYEAGIPHVTMRRRLAAR